MKRSGSFALWVPLGVIIILAIIHISSNSYDKTSFLYSLTITLATTVITQLIAVLAKLSSYERTVNKKLESLESTITEEVKTLISNNSASFNGHIVNLKEEMYESLNVARRLIGNLSKDKKNIERIRLSLSRKNAYVERIGNTYLDQIFPSISTSKKDFAVKGEVASLDLYVILWKEIVILQKKIANQCLNIDGSLNHEEFEKKKLIVRAIHSNDIRLLDTEYTPQANELLEQQVNFVENGGVIIRLLTSHDQEIPENYKSTQKKMIANEIDARFVTYYGSGKTDHDYDFAWITNNEFGNFQSKLSVNIVAKWYSGAGGRMLRKCEIHDGLEKEVYTLWDTLATRSEKDNGAFKKIPSFRKLTKRSRKILPIFLNKSKSNKTNSA